MATTTVDTSPSSGLSSWLNPVGLAWLAVAAMLASLGSARSVLSIGAGVLAAAMLWNALQQRGLKSPHPPSYKRLALLAGGLFIVALLSFFQTDQIGDWLKDLNTKLPLLLIPLALYLLPPFSRKQLYLLALIFVLAHTVVALISLTVYAGNYEQMITRVAENSSVGVVTGVSHIYFGTILAFVVCLSLYMYLRRVQVWKSWEPRMWFVLTLINFVALHLFTSRTGLMALYGGLGLGGLYYLVEKKIWWVGLILVSLLVLIPILAYQFVPSFRLRVDVTRWDIQQYQNPEADLSYNSASLRLLAWDTAWKLIQENAIMGVGMEDVKPEMEEAYRQNGAFERAKRPLDDPHNQYLTLMLGAGIGGFLLLIGLFAGIILSVPPPGRLLAVTFIGLMAAALLFESILERQIGMTLWTLTIMLLPYWGKMGKQAIEVPFSANK